MSLKYQAIFAGFGAVGTLWHDLDRRTIMDNEQREREEGGQEEREETCRGKRTSARVPLSDDCIVS